MIHSGDGKLITCMIQSICFCVTLYCTSISVHPACSIDSSSLSPSCILISHPHVIVSVKMYNDQMQTITPTLTPTIANIFFSKLSLLMCHLLLLYSHHFPLPVISFMEPVISYTCNFTIALCLDLDVPRNFINSYMLPRGSCLPKGHALYVPWGNGQNHQP